MFQKAFFREPKVLRFQQKELFNRKRQKAVRQKFLGNVADRQSLLPADFSRIRHKAKKRFEKYGLAGTIRTDNGERLSPPYTEGKVLQYPLAFKSNRKILYIKDNIGFSTNFFMVS